MSLQDKIPRTNIESIAEEYDFAKFVQFYLEDEPYLRLGYPNHEDIILRMILECQEVGEPLVSQSKLSEMAYTGVPAAAGKYRAIGMGMAQIDITNKAIQLGEYSMSYKIWPDKKHLEQITPFLKDWKIEIK